MADKKNEVGSLLSQAKEQEKEYDWLGASESYAQAIALVPDTNLQEIREILEFRSYALYKASLQSDDSRIFEKRANATVRQYSETRKAYEKAKGPDSKARMARCDAMNAFIGFMRAADAASRKRLANESWEFAMEALDEFASAGSGLEFRRTFNELSLCPALISELVPDFQTRAKRMGEATRYGEKALELTGDLSDPSVIARTLVLVSSFLERGGSCGFFGVDSQSYREKSVECLQRAEAVSRDEMLKNLPLMMIVGDAPLDPNRDSKKEFALAENALDLVRKTGDRLMIGHAFACLSFYASWTIETVEDKEGVDALLRRALDYANEARAQLSRIGFRTWSHHQGWVMSPDLCSYVGSAYYERDPVKRGNLAEKVLQLIPEYRQQAVQSGYLWHIAEADFAEAYSYKYLAGVETNIDEKQRLLKRAVELGRKYIRFIDQFDAGNPFNLGANHLFLADLLGDFAEATVHGNTKIQAYNDALDLYRKAIEELGKGVKLALITMDPAVLGALGRVWYNLANRYRALYELAHQPDALRSAIDGFEKSADAYLKAGMQSRAAESLWEAARLYDEVDEPFKAAERFLSASREFRSSADKLSRLKNLYTEHAVYLEAWAEFEEAKNSHGKQEFQKAHDHFEKAAQLHATLPRWRFLASNYRAWSQVEMAEADSREDRCEEAARVFDEAANLFRESRASLEEASISVEHADEKQMIMRLLNASEPRLRYCLARATIENARQMDVKGMNSSSAEMYKKAADELELLANEAASEKDRKEMKLIAILSRAWQKMNQAEAEVSAEPYREAASLFEDAKALCTDDRSRALAMGHSRFCKALEAGTRFADTRDSTLHLIATKNLESASSFYLKAGADTSSEYARASKLFFDAYAYLDEASQEKDQQKSAKTYAIAEKVLLASSDSYSKAGQPGKRDQVLKLLDKVKKERELALSLTEVFQAPIGVSSTTAFGVPTPSQEEAVGLERFAHADVQATLVVTQKELQVGEELSLDIELVNAGKAVAQLIKLQDPFPEGFTLKEEPGGYRMEDSYLSLRGRRLDPLKTADIALTLKPMRLGQFDLKPRILYLDESGKYKVHELEPMRVSIGAGVAGPMSQVTLSDNPLAAEACSLLTGLSVVTLSHYRIVGNYVRYSGSVLNALKDARQKIVAACRSPSPKRENYIIWAPPGSGKTYFVQEIAALLAASVRYCELNLAKLDEAGFRSGLAELRSLQGACLCLIDEVDAKPNDSWPYEALIPLLDASVAEEGRLVLVLTGSSGSSLEEMKKAIASRPKGSDLLSRIPADNEYSIPSMGVGDKLLVVLSQFRQAGKQMGRDVREVEKLGLYYVALNPRLSNARQLREFAVRCAERVLPSDDRLRYDSLFRPGDPENKSFWTQAVKSAGTLLDSFLLIED